MGADRTGDGPKNSRKDDRLLSAFLRYHQHAVVFSGRGCRVPEPDLRGPVSSNFHPTFLDFFHKSGMISREQMFLSRVRSGRSVYGTEKFDGKGCP